MSSLGDRNTRRHTADVAVLAGKRNFKKPGACKLQAGTCKPGLTSMITLIAYLLHNYRLEKSSVNVADFGLSRDVYVEDYYKMQGDTPLPVKWLAPEALFDREFSVKTDVASNYLATPVLCVEA